MTMNIFWHKEYASNTQTLITPRNDLNTQLRDKRVLMQGYIKMNKKRQSPKKLSKSIHMQGILPTAGLAKDKVFKRSCHSECCLKKGKKSCALHNICFNLSGLDSCKCRRACKLSGAISNFGRQRCDEMKSTSGAPVSRARFALSC